MLFDKVYELTLLNLIKGYGMNETLYWKQLAVIFIRNVEWNSTFSI